MNETEIIETKRYMVFDNEVGDTVVLITVNTNGNVDNTIVIVFESGSHTKLTVDRARALAQILNTVADHAEDTQYD